MTAALTLFRREDFSVLTNPEALATRDEAIANASLVATVKDKATRDVAIEAQKELKTLLKAAEDNRVELKSPVLKLGKLIDSTAAEFSEPIQREFSRIDVLVCEYESEQRELARKIEEARQRELEAERKRLEEEARKAERERLRIEAEKQREIEEARRKAAAIADAARREAAQKEAARLAEIEEARRKQEEVKRAEEAKRQAEALEQKRAEMGPPVAVSVATGQSVRESWDFTVEDIHKLYLHKGQQCVELSVKRAAVLALINAGGLREIPGLKIFQVTKNRVNPTPGRKAIDV